MRNPLVTIGLPVYKGEACLSQALDSLRAQSYESLELIVCDNASDDRTMEIALRHRKEDGRIRVVRNAVNLGAGRNFDRVFRLSKGDLFMWASDHDLWHPDYISRAVRVLVADPAAVLAFSRYRMIDPEGRPIGSPSDSADVVAPSVVERFRKVLRWGAGLATLIYGVVRAEVLRDTLGRFNVYPWDVVLAAALSTRGTIVQIPEPMFYWRQIHPEDASPVRWLQRVLKAISPPWNRIRPMEVVPQLALELICVAVRSPVQPAMKARLAWEAVRSFTKSDTCPFATLQMALRLLPEGPTTIKEFFQPLWEKWHWWTAGVSAKRSRSLFAGWAAATPRDPTDTPRSTSSDAG